MSSKKSIRHVGGPLPQPLSLHLLAVVGWFPRSVYKVQSTGRELPPAAVCQPLSVLIRTLPGALNSLSLPVLLRAASIVESASDKLDSLKNN